MTNVFDQPGFRRRTAAAVVLGVCGVITSSTASSAHVGVADELDVDSVAEVVSEAAPAALDAASPQMVTPERAVAAAAGVGVVAQSTGSDVVLDVQAAGHKKVSIGLPEELSLEPGGIASDGTIVYTADNVPVAATVQVSNDGSVAVSTVLSDSAAPTSYTYEFEGVSLAPGLDGSVAVVDESLGVRTIVGVVAKPWATDAAGKSVATEYQIEGSRLVQVVHTDSATVFPVVADPQLRFGTRIYWALTRTEQRYFGSMGSAGAAAYLCAQTAGLACPLAAAAAVGIGMFLADRGGYCPTSRPWLQVGFPYAWVVGMSPISSIACVEKI